MSRKTRSKIAEFIRTTRESKGETQEEAAIAIGVFWNTIAKWEGGATKPGIGSVAGLSKWSKVEAVEVLRLIQES